MAQIADTHARIKRGRAVKTSVDRDEDKGDLPSARELLAALNAMRMGDFSVRLPGDRLGLDGKIADAFNAVVAANQRIAEQLQWVGQSVGREGKAKDRVKFSLTDGAWGTQLQERGLKPGDCPDAWNLTHAEDVAAVARAYVEAGSRLVITNTFGANRFVLARHGLVDQAAELNRRGVALSRAAADGRASVFASIGPSGLMIMLGQTSAEELQAAFAEQARAMAEAGADGLVLESFSDLAEIRAAIGAAKPTGLPVVACMTFDSGANKDRTMMGVTPEQAAAALVDAGADVIGANCGQGIAGFVDVCRRLRAAADLPIWIKANAGLPQMAGGRAVYAQTPAEFAGFIPPLLDAGANFVGGCCGTSPAFIAAVRERLDALVH